MNPKIMEYCKELRALGVKGRLYVVPRMNKRCFVPCVLGSCNCRTIVSGSDLTIVNEEYYQSRLKEYANHLILCQESLDNRMKDVDAPEAFNG